MAGSLIDLILVNTNTVFFINRFDCIYIDRWATSNRQIVYFRTYELAEQALKILGEETIRTALSTDY